MKAEQEGHPELMQRSKQEEESHHLRLEVKAGGALKQQVQFRLIPENALGMISSTTGWTGGYSATAYQCAAAAE